MSDEFFRIRGRAIRAAREARGALGLSLLDPLDDVLELVETDGVGVAILDLGDGFAGAYLRPGGAPIAFVNGTDAPQRQRFTLAHEYGHHCMGHATRVDPPRAIAGFTDEPDEVQANTFASEFLMPRDGTLTWLEENAPDAHVTLDTVVRFAAAFGASAAAACIRLKSAKVIDDELYARLMDEIREGHHEVLAEALALEFCDDAIANATIPRLPPTLRGSALGAMLAGRVTPAQVGAGIGRTTNEIVAMLEATGLGVLLPRVA